MIILIKCHISMIINYIRKCRELKFRIADKPFDSNSLINKVGWHPSINVGTITLTGVIEF